MTSKRVWLITGASTGFGHALTGVVLDSGGTVVATARDPDTLSVAIQHRERSMFLGLDVTRQVDIDAAVAAALERFGRIDVLVNNAGYGLVGAAEELTETEVRDQFETNFFGADEYDQGRTPLNAGCWSGSDRQCFVGLWVLRILGVDRIYSVEVRARGILGVTGGRGAASRSEGVDR